MASLISKLKVEAPSTDRYRQVQRSFEFKTEKRQTTDKGLWGLWRLGLGADELGTGGAKTVLVPG